MSVALLAVALLESGAATLSLGGYARTMAAVRSSQVQGLDRQDSGVSATVLRAEWKLVYGEALSLEVHQRAYLQITGGGAGLGGGAGPGLGVSAAPGRTLDLAANVFARDDLRLQHDINRLVVRAWLGPADLTLGRQAVSWGNAALFPVADLWTTFSPFELDTSQKRGIDAARALFSLGEKGELELLVADRGKLSDTSFGARATYFSGVADLWAAAAKHWNEAMLFAGAAAEAGAFKLRVDAALPYDLDAREISLPRATVGVDWFRPELFVTVEGHFNGAGTGPASRYLGHALSSAPLARGETYWLGRWYAGTAVSWHPWEPLALGASVLSNLRDPSAMATVSAVYSPSQAVQLAAGGYRGLGGIPRLAPLPALTSELGSYGSMWYVELSAFF